VSVSIRSLYRRVFLPTGPYLSTSLTREDILGVDLAVLVVVHDGDANDAKEMANRGITVR
jgi:hypothetical protein